MEKEEREEKEERVDHIERVNTYRELLSLFGYKSMPEEESQMSQIRERVDLMIEKEDHVGYLSIPSPPRPLPLNVKGFTEEEERTLQAIWELVWGYHIYVDGSSIEGQIGYGYLVLQDGEKIKEEAGAVTGEIFTSSNQVGGELMAVEKALTWCKRMEIERVVIHCDLEATIYWARGEYRTTIPLTRHFKSFIDSCGIEITWKKVESHSGEPFNEEVDRLAKKGASKASTSSTSSTRSLEELEEKGHRFALFLQEKGLVIEEKGIFNRQSVKLLLKRDGTKLGHFNLYSTKKKGLVPHYHEILKEEDRVELAKDWDLFMREGG